MSKRDIIEIIAQVIELIPEKDYPDLHRQLGSISYSARYIAPEGMGDIWYEASVVIAEGLKYSSDPIMLCKVQDLWVNNEYEKYK